MKTLLKYLRPYVKQLTLGPFFKLLEAIIEVLLPTIMAMIIKNVEFGVPGQGTGYFLNMGLLLLGLVTFGVASALVCQYFAARASQGYGTTLRNEMFRHISSLSYAEIDHFGTASLINRITNDVNIMQQAVAMLIRLVVRAPFICIGSFVMALFLNYKLALILLAIIPVFCLILYLIIRKSTPMYRQNQKKLDHLGAVTRENLSGVRIIRAFAHGKKEEKRFRDSNEELSKIAIRVGKISALLNPLTTLVLNFAIIAVLWFGGIQINIGDMAQADIIAFVNYITQILLALIVVSNLIVLYTKAFASAGRIAEVLNTRPSVTGGAVLPQPLPGADAVTFDHVCFKYGTSGDNALENISFTVKRGQTIGIVGGTGSGKSTLVHLIPRLYDATSGSIAINGVDIKDYPLDGLRRAVSIVPQKTVLFTGTVAENIRWGNPSATDEEVAEAAKIAQADDFIRALKDGYNTRVERGGVNFSGGQRQRLAIARAIAAKPEILILDDSASALDFATDAALRRAIRASTRDMTVFIVSQRTSSILSADQIIVLDDGRIAGAGTHGELFQSCEEYREICLSQLSESEAAKA